MARALPEPWRARVGFAWSYAHELHHPVWVIFARELTRTGRERNRSELAHQVAKELLATGLQLDPRTDPGAIREVVIHREYEQDGFVPDPGSTVLDIGAQHGEYTVLCAVRYKATVLAFEPMESNCAIIAENVRLNGSPPVQVFPLALGDHEGELRGYRYDTMLVRDAGPMGGRAVRVRQTTLDSLPLARFLDGRRVFMKVDVEGFEQEVLAGSVGILARYHPRLIIESDPKREEAVTRFLAGAGYVILHVTRKATGRLIFAAPRLGSSVPDPPPVMP